MTSHDAAKDKEAKHGSGTMIALVRGRSSRAVLRNTVRSLALAPSFLVSRLARRDPNLWVFGNLHGFRDSPRYLAEHVVRWRPDIRVRWIAHTAEEAGAVLAAGIEPALIGTPEAKHVQRRAGVAFFSHGFRDLDLPLVGGAYLVYLWHGVPVKRIGLDLNVAQAKRRRLTVRVAARIVRSTTFRAYRLVNLYVASGELERERFMTAFGTSPERVKPLGSARFDVIRGAEAYRLVMPRDLRADLGYAADDRIVLWVPTHRHEYGDAAWLPTLTLEDLGALNDSKVQILVKTHPRADWDVYRERLPDHPRIRLLRESDVDVNCLLNLADALVTDYSSVVFDYAVLGRPVHFFAPDVEPYTADRGLYIPYDELTNGMHHTTWPDLLRALAEGDNAGASGEGMLLWKRVADYGRNNDAPETCRRIADAIVGRA